MDPHKVMSLVNELLDEWEGKEEALINEFSGLRDTERHKAEMVAGRKDWEDKFKKALGLIPHKE